VYLSGDDLDLPPDSAAVEALRRLQHDDVVTLEAQFHRAFYEALAGFARNGLHAIGEVLFKSAQSYAEFQQATQRVPTLVVHCTCDLATAVERERQRADRTSGVAELTATQEWVPSLCDLTIDTTQVETESAAARINRRLEAWEDGGFKRTGGSH
jgi:chloramphenicol 3-O-phosphotransferase